MKKRLLAIIASVATVVAAIVASSACFWFSYQPNEPEALREK